MAATASRMASCLDTFFASDIGKVPSVRSLSKLGAGGAPARNALLVVDRGWRSAMTGGQVGQCEWRVAPAGRGSAPCHASGWSAERPAKKPDRREAEHGRGRLVKPVLRLPGSAAPARRWASETETLE